MSPWYGLIRKLSGGADRCAVAVGVHEATFRVDKDCGWMGLGVVPAANVTSSLGVFDVGYAIASSGSCWGRGKFLKDFHVMYDSDDVITVRLDLGASTVTFLKNATTIGSLEGIPRGDAYHFAFGAGYPGGSVTIVENLG